MIHRVLPSRFYTHDPADLAEELIAARQDDAEYQAKCAIANAMEQSSPSPDRSHRYRGTAFKQLRIRALLAAVKKGKP